MRNESRPSPSLLEGNSDAHRPCAGGSCRRARLCEPPYGEALWDNGECVRHKRQPHGRSRAILALGILAWLGRRQEAKALRTIVVPFLFVWFLVKSVVAYWAVANGAFEVTVGITVLVFDVILAAVYAYYFFVMVVTKPEKSR